MGGPQRCSCDATSLGECYTLGVTALEVKQLVVLVARGVLMGSTRQRAQLGYSLSTASHDMSWPLDALQQQRRLPAGRA